MRIWIMSDLHTDDAPFELPPTPSGAEVLVIAGDVGDGHHKAIAWLKQHAVPRGLPVVFVAGNHDYFAGDLLDDCAEYYAAASVTLLHVARPSIEIGGVRFVGSTCWTDYEVAGDADAARRWASQTMPDLLNIDVGMRRVSTRDLLDLHRRQRAAIERELWGIHDGPTIVVTHHAPHPKSLQRWPGADVSDGSYASNLTATIEAQRPALWVHGHVHQSRDYVVGGTRVICNPRGYPTPRADGETMENPDFNPALVIEI